MQHETRVAIAGLRLKSAPEDVRSLPLTDPDAALIDGQAVGITATGETCETPTADSTGYGIVVFQHIGKSGKSKDKKAEAYIKDDIVPVMTKGRIWVKPNEPITARGKDAKVYVRTSNGTDLAPIGSLGATATDSTEIVGAFWDVPTNADGLAVVDLG